MKLGEMRYAKVIWPLMEFMFILQPFTFLDAIYFQKPQVHPLGDKTKTESRTE